MDVVFNVVLSQTYLKANFSIPAGLKPSPVRNSRGLASGEFAYWYGGLTPSSDYSNKLWQFSPGRIVFPNCTNYQEF